MMKKVKSIKNYKAITESNLDSFKREVAKQIFGTFPDGNCVSCGYDKVNESDFKDDLSKKEFKISKLCQSCQDDVFNQED